MFFRDAVCLWEDVYHTYDRGNCRTQKQESERNKVRFQKLVDSLVISEMMGGISS